MENKEFDCVEMKRRGSALIYEIVKDMTLEEEVEFWRKETDKLLRDIEQRKAGVTAEPAGVQPK